MVAGFIGVRPGDRRVRWVHWGAPLGSSGSSGGHCVDWGAPLGSSC